MADNWLKRRLELERMMGVDALFRLPDAARAAETDLAAAEREVSACTLCRLSETRTQTVFARGSAQAALMFIGEGPGREEDLQGVPFIGPAGRLLDRMIFAIGLQRDEVYVANIVKCRPPENREPRPDEVAACAPYLERQVDLVRPRLICTLGRPASCSLLGSSQAMGDMRGRWYSYRGIPVLPTYHPAYLLRSPGQKKKTWEDLKLIIAALHEAGPLASGAPPDG